MRRRFDAAAAIFDRERQLKGNEACQAALAELLASEKYKGQSPGMILRAAPFRRALRRIVDQHTLEAT